MTEEEEIVPDAAVARLDAKQFAKTSTLNQISRASSLNGLQNIFMPAGRCIIREQAVIRGDLARVRKEESDSCVSKDGSSH